jgi:hypothetical protein
MKRNILALLSALTIAGCGEMPTSQNETETTALAGNETPAAQTNPQPSIEAQSLALKFPTLTGQGTLGFYGRFIGPNTLVPGLLYDNGLGLGLGTLNPVNGWLDVEGNGGHAVAIYGQASMIGIQGVGGYTGLEGDGSVTGVVGKGGMVGVEGTGSTWGFHTDGNSYVGLNLEVDGDINGTNNAWGTPTGPIRCANDGTTVCSCPNGYFQTGTVFSATGISQIYCNQL